MSSSVNDDVFSDFGQDSWLLSVANVCEKIVRFCSYIFCWAYPMLILAILISVIMRYGFNNGMIAILISVIMRYGFNNGMMVFEEIQWTFYGVGLMFGLSYAEITNSQVRVDVIADKLFKPRTRYIIEIVGIILFMTPFLYVVIVNGADYVADSFRVGETSPNPLGLPFKWLFKGIIPVSFSLLGIAILARLLRKINVLFNSKKD